MARYLCWIVGRRDETAREIKARVKEAWRVAERELGAPLCDIAMSKLPPAAKHLPMDRTETAYADFERPFSIVFTALWRYQTRIRTTRGKKVVTHYRWINDHDERQGGTWETLGDAVAYAARHKAFFNIRLLPGKTPAERSIMRMLAGKHKLILLSD